MMVKYQDEAHQVLSHRQALTGANRVSYMDMNDFVVMKHTIDGINDYFETEQGMKEAQDLKTVEQVRERSWEVANTNMLQALKSRNNLEQLLNDNYWKRETMNFWRMEIITKEKDLSQSLSPLMQERVAELKSKLPQELQDRFTAAVINENKEKKNSAMEGFKVYQEVFEKFPELSVGSKEIKIIQSQLPQAVNAVEANKIYELKTVEDVIRHSGAKIEEPLSLKLDVTSNRVEESIEKKTTLKM